MLVSSAFGSLSAYVGVGLSLSTLVTLTVSFLGLSLLISVMKIKKNTAIISLPLLFLCVMSVFHDAAHLANQSYRPENISLVLISAYFCMIIPSICYCVGLFNCTSTMSTLRVATNIHVLLSMAVVVIYEEEPAFAIAGIPFFCYLLVRFLRERKSFDLIILLLMVIMSMAMTSRIVLLAQMVIVVCAIAFGVGVRLKTKVIFSTLFLLVTMIALSFLDMEKFIGGGDSAMTVGGLGINTSGRIHHWEIVWDSAVKTPLFGTGYSIPIEMFNVHRWGHPHNDYLRIFHKFGITGLFLFLVLIFGIFAGLSIRLPKPTHDLNDSFLINRTAFYSLIGLLVVMITDNPLAYPYIIMPAFFMIGAAFNYSPAEK